MFASLFRKKAPPKKNPVIEARLAARLQPIPRGDLFEDPLNERLSDLKLGHVIGGGTELADDPVGIQACDVVMEVWNTSPETIAAIIAALEEFGAPKGSELRMEGQPPVPFGVTEGMALYLNGTDLAPEVCEMSDINTTLEGLFGALAGEGRMFGHFEGSRETGLYFYGAHYARMRELALAYAASDPLCENCRIEQIA